MSPFQLYFNPLLITQKLEVCIDYTFVVSFVVKLNSIFFLSFWQLWRLVTPFCFFGTFSFNFLFNMIFTYRYCRMLEEGSFRGRTADFVYMFVFGCLTTVVIYLLIVESLHQSFTIKVLLLHSNSFALGLSTCFSSVTRSLQCSSTFGLDETHTSVWTFSVSCHSEYNI